MKKSANLLMGLAGLLFVGAMGVGCGSPAEPDEKKMHDMLSGPPSLEGMKGARPRGAKQPAGNPAGQAPGAPPAAGGK